MQPLRELIRGSLARSLRSLEQEDRLEAAIPVVCGSALAAHCTVAHLDSDGTLHLRVDAGEWMPPLRGMRERLLVDLARVAGVPLSGLHFHEAGSAPDRPLPLRPPDGRAQVAPGSPRPTRPFVSSAIPSNRYARRPA